ncbi:MAG: radical SAM protein [Elusimicrobia bacterium]|nr:radical SAM protein [Elusimicrobiota bacterium]
MIRETQGVCPRCLRAVAAQIREAEGGVWLIRSCAEHGESRALLSVAPAYFRDLHRFYSSVMRRSLPQRDYILRLTERCNLECPICLAGANQDVLADFTVEDVRSLVKGMRGKKLDLMGCEPTLLKDLPEMIRVIARSGNIAALHTNGIALADLAYVRRLKDAGLHEVHLQFDGLDDRVYQAIRGRPLLDTKLRAMDNLTELGIPVDLVVTVLAGVNEGELLPILEFGAKRANVKEVFFLGCRPLGRAAAGFEDRHLMPDQVIDLLAQATGGRISRDKVRRFQKLYFAALSIFKVRKCLYVQHYLLLRSRDGGYQCWDDLVDTPRLEQALERFRARREKDSAWAAPLFLLEALPILVNPRTLGLLGEFLALALLMKSGFNLKRVKPRTLMLGYITACDPGSYNAFVAENCGKGEVSRDLGLQEAGALANVLRERRWRKL